MKKNICCLKKELETIKYNHDNVGPLFANIYLEIIQKAIQNTDLEYACDVIDKFTKELETSKQAAVSNMARAWIEFEKKNYERTLHHLSQVSAFNLFLKINTKMLYMKTYYEMNALETGLSSVDSFRHFIMETKELGNSRRENLQRNYEIIKRIYK
jgi:lipopolysaccharide biosynthesis regulator YciM